MCNWQASYCDRNEYFQLYRNFVNHSEAFLASVSVSMPFLSSVEGKKEKCEKIS